MKFNLSIDELDKLTTYLQNTLGSTNQIVLLQGDLASGKTTLVKKYVQSIGLKDTVTSPTFSLQSIYGDNIYHYDVYNKSLEEFISLGLLEEFEHNGIHFVEWGDNRLKRLLEEYGFDVFSIKIEKKEDKREYIIES